MRKFFIIFSLLVLVSLSAPSTLSQYNTFYGTLAGGTITTGQSNSFFGYRTGNFTTTGSDNSFFGSIAGYQNTTGERNTFIGASVGVYNTIGNDNSFVGSYAGALNSTGFGNSFFGSGAGQSVTSGDHNSFFGRNAGSATVGRANVFFGAGAGFYNTSGRDNAFVGTVSGSSNVTGTNNTLLGADTDVSRDDLSYATAIGASAVALGSNSITLGRSHGQDWVRIPGLVLLSTLSTGGNTPLCRSIFNFIATCSSSERYKSNIQNLDLGLSLIRRLRPVSFNWRDGGGADLGLVAEEVNKVEPLLTTLNDKGEVEGVKYDRLGVVLINAINEQQRHIENLEKQVAVLKSLVCSRKSRAQICR